MYKNYKSIEFVKPGGLDLKDRLVAVQRVTKVTKGGKKLNFRAVIAIGDKKGTVGVGIGKADEILKSKKKL